jgi:hypothetical protein
MSEAAAELQKALDENRRLKESLQESGKIFQGRVDKESEPVHESSFKPGLEIFAVNPSGEEASCYFRDISDVEQGLENWVETLKLMWGGDSVSAAFRAQLKTENAEMAFTLPKWNLGEASGKLLHFRSKIIGKSQHSIGTRSSKS